MKGSEFFSNQNYGFFLLEYELSSYVLTSQWKNCTVFWSTGCILSSRCCSIQHGFFKDVDLMKSTQSEIYFKQGRESLLE